MVDDLIDAGLPAAGWRSSCTATPTRCSWSRLREVSATVLTVTPVPLGRPAAADRLPRLIEAVCTRQLDAVTFTSAPGAEATLAAAADSGRLPDARRTPCTTTSRPPPSAR